jgi:hypothetical protein
VRNVIFGLTALLWGLCPLGAPVYAVSPLARVGPGVEYIHQRIGDGPWSIHAVKVDRAGARFGLTTALAQGQVYGLASVREQVAGVCEGSGEPVAAVNGDFFHIRRGPYQGDPLGLHIVGGELVSAPTGASFWIDTEGQPHVGDVKSRFRVTGPAEMNIRFGLNEARADDRAVLYTPALGSSTRTVGGSELVLRRAGEGEWLPLQVGGHYQAQVTAVHADGNTPLERNAVVLSIGPELTETAGDFKPGMMLSLHLETTPDLAGASAALGGGPILLRGGEAPAWGERTQRHPRTTVGWNREHLLLAVVDGRQTGLSAGMNYAELSRLMRRLGCTEAMNLDGGGSSTLWLGGQVMNSPSDGRERRVANSLIVMSRGRIETP